MCGVAGFVNFDGRPASEALLDAMTRRLAHRGPDGSGTWTSGGAGLGHRRLSIIDLEGGGQPFLSPCGLVGLSYNGELYNFMDLRRDLESLGHRFSTRSDTEVVLASYLEWGEDCVARFRGMFAFVVLDTIRRCLFLARDHLGIKPLYWFATGKAAAFASELGALTLHPDAPDEIDLEAMDEYLWLQYIPPPRTIYAGVFKLGPGQAARVDFDGTVKGPWRYWRPECTPVEGLSRREWLARLDEAISESVRVHLQADVPFGVFLSGGLDSGAVLARMTRELGRPVDAFSIGFDDPDYDELDLAAATAALHGARFHAEVVREDALSLLPRLVLHYGEPFGDSSAIPAWFVSRLARRGVPMVLSGDGGDECFAGYESHMRFMAHLETLGPGRTPELGDWLQFIAYLPKVVRQDLWRPEHLAKISMSLPSYAQAFSRAASRAAGVDIARLMDLETYLPGDILTKMDVASMAHGLEVRTPLADIRVVKAALETPRGLLVDKSGGVARGKAILRELLSPGLPPEVVRAPKRGFAAPLKRWFDTTGRGGREIRARLLSSDGPLMEWLVPEGVRRVLDKGETGPVWMLLVLDEWLRGRRSGRFDHAKDVAV